MSRRIVAALVVVFACGCGGSPTPPASKASSTAVSSDGKTEIIKEEGPKKKIKKGSNSTTKKSALGVLPTNVAATETPAVEKPAVEVAKTEAAEKPVAIPASFTKSVTLSVPDMHCEFACYPKVKKTLESVAGVAGVKADIENHTVSFMADPAKFDEAKTLAALKDAKYPATVKLADAK